LIENIGEPRKEFPQERKELSFLRVISSRIEGVKRKIAGQILK
jgi:hypothetical protein